MYIKTEYVFGDRASGKSNDIINQVNYQEEIGIVCRDINHAKELQKRIQERLGEARRCGEWNRLENIVFITKWRQFYGHHFSKVFIDDADYIIGEELDRIKEVIMDSFTPEGGIITYYFNKPGKNFSIRTI